MKATPVMFEATATQRFTWDKDEAPRFTQDKGRPNEQKIAVTTLLVIRTSGGAVRTHWGGWKVNKEGLVSNAPRKGRGFPPDTPWFDELLETIPRPVATVDT